LHITVNDLLFKLADAFEGTLIGLSLKEGLLSKYCQLSLQAVSLKSRFLDAFHHVVGLLGGILGSPGFGLKSEVISVHLLEFLEKAVMISLVLLEDCLPDFEVVSEVVQLCPLLCNLKLLSP